MRPCACHRRSGPRLRAALYLVAILGLAVAVPAAGAGVRSDRRAELRAVPLVPEPAPRSGVVPLGPGEAMTPMALEQALRADAARLWQRGDGGAGLVVHVQAVVWRDGALGCPLPDRMYTQAAVPGWRVVVDEGARQAEYHASRSGLWLLCPRDRLQLPLPGDATR